MDEFVRSRRCLKYFDATDQSLGKDAEENGSSCPFVQLAEQLRGFFEVSECVRLEIKTELGARESIECVETRAKTPDWLDFHGGIFGSIAPAKNKDMNKPLSFSRIKTVYLNHVIYVFSHHVTFDVMLLLLLLPDQRREDHSMAHPDPNAIERQFYTSQSAGS